MRSKGEVVPALNRMSTPVAKFCHFESDAWLVVKWERGRKHHRKRIQKF